MERDRIEDIEAWLANHFFGKYRGTVEGNADVTGRGRLDVKVPAVLGDQVVTAMPCVPYAGNGVGLHLLPEKGTGVWVEFEAGDPSYPVWTGFFWADGELPEGADATMKLLKTGRNTLRMDDSAGEITVETDQGAVTTMNSAITHDAGATVTIDAASVTAEGGGSSVTVDSGGVALASSGTGKIDVTTGGTSVNAGALEVS
ncbi:MAG: phage baseplate assembly protein V [Pararhodobacter sp.]